MPPRLAFSIPQTLLHFRTLRTLRALSSPPPLRYVSVPSSRPLMTSNNQTPIPTQTPDPTPIPTQNPTPTQTPTPSPPAVTLLYDGECPLCMKEINFLRSRQSRLNLSALRFVDVASPDYEPSENADISYQSAMKVMHAITHDGKVVTGVPVFRLAYEAVELGWVYGVTKLPGIGWAAATVYNVWARWRLKISGRPELEEIMDMRREKAEKACR